MRRMKYILALTVFGIHFFTNGIWAQTNEEPIQVIDRTELQNLLSKNDDTLRLFNFWATWCKPCVKELPFFEELNSRWSNAKSKIYLISLDFNEGTNKRLQKFIEKNKLKSEVLLFDGGDPNKWINEVAHEWSGTIPASLVVGNGRRCFIESSFANTNDLYDFVNTCNKSN